MQSGLGDLDELYQEVLLDHYRNPRNTDRLEEPASEVDAVNPFCGDEIHMQLGMDGERVAKISVSGQGCSISQATGSLLTEIVEGKTPDEARALRELFRGLMMGEDLTDDQLDELEDSVALQGVRRFPVRIKCALLSWSALSDALDKVAPAG
ncbi:MAG: SUF system NifU family Fe-S cluster assembly protein [Chloroflexi bacterium]|jgi:nitrogen fixation protein NifU and related proteins|nr:SUF system NifU family Fe-S cluster assembly protein [Chloroflexota bacterium]MBT4073956.1 SUF system NifU family Fe-S cluster assembly protein [Chloroflexota bacterium]MBT4513758.1 SUF system NifU family Fe-S cluster assembly protein [Chloroflexota bacterium]MBT6680712.1 SUF system NifU family Fe-S cluster assembly protein [Chloroflexota bacterium]